MAQLAQELGHTLNQSVTDETGIEGRYDFQLRWAKEQPDPSTPPERMAPLEDLPLPMLKDALDKLGLKVEKKKVSTGILVVDHLEKVPTGN